MREINSDFNFVFVAMRFINFADSDFCCGGLASVARDEFVDFADAALDVFFGGFADVVIDTCDCDLFDHFTPFVVLDLGFAAEVWLEDGWNINTHVRGLVVLDDSDKDAAEGKSGGVVSMDKFDCSRGATDAGFETTGLIVGHIVGCVSLAVFALPW